MSSFSQTDTTKPQTNTPVVQSDTTKIRIKTPVAKLAIKDILKGDGCEVELKLTQEKLIKTEEREKEKDFHIILLEEKDKNNNFMLGKKDEQLKVSEDLTKSLHKELSLAILHLSLYTGGGGEVHWDLSVWNMDEGNKG